jgi:hypothetical protein
MQNAVRGVMGEIPCGIGKNSGGLRGKSLHTLKGGVNAYAMQMRAKVEFFPSHKLVKETKICPLRSKIIKG